MKKALDLALAARAHGVWSRRRPSRPRPGDADARDRTHRGGYDDQAGSQARPARGLHPLVPSALRWARSPGGAGEGAREGDGNQLFDAWDDYLAALGLPDYKLDLPRGSQTNAIMVAAFERPGVALCDRAVERDFKAPMNERVIFAFDAPAAMDDKAFAARFDVLHRTFLGYPAKLAPGRTEDFHALYAKIASHHTQKSRFSPVEAGWAAVCYGLARHPELHLYWRVAKRRCNGARS